MATILNFMTLDSTNTYLKQRCGELSDFTVVWSEEQTGGRGRYSRDWRSIPGKDLTFSLLVPLGNLDAELWPTVTQVAGICIAEVIEKEGVAPKIKWPNDLLVAGKKICGILCELIMRHGKPYCVIGIGINVNRSRETLASITQRATSLIVETGHIVDREVLLHSIVDSIIRSIAELNDQGFIRFQSKIESRLAFLGEKIRVTDGNQDFEGVVHGVSKQGWLMLLSPESGVMELSSGEISFVRTENE